MQSNSRKYANCRSQKYGCCVIVNCILHMYQVAEGECEHQYCIVHVIGTVQLTEVCEPLKYEHCCVLYCTGCSPTQGSMRTADVSGILGILAPTCLGQFCKWIDLNEKCSVSSCILNKGGVGELGAVKILALPRLAWPPSPYPNPGTLVDLTTKAGKCDSRHFDDKSA